MIVVIEPHADDAFLSLGGLLELWIKEGQKVTIVTVYSGTRNRARDAKAYAQAIGADWVGLGAVEYGSMKPGDPAGELPSDFAKKLQVEEASTFFVPLGVGGHPEHLLVRDEAQQVPQGMQQLLYYVDQPYASKLKHFESLNDSLRGRKVYAINRPGARKYRHVPLFKDQSYFFFNENGKDDTLAWKTFELVVE